MAIRFAACVRGARLGLRSRDGFLDDDLQLDVGGAALRCALKGGDAFVEREVRRDERLEIDLAGSQQGDGLGVDVCVTEDGFDAGFLGLRGDNVESRLRRRHADEHQRSGGRKQIEDSFEGLGASAGFKDNVGAPAGGKLGNVRGE